MSNLRWLDTDNLENKMKYYSVIKNETKWVELEDIKGMEVVRLRKTIAGYSLYFAGAKKQNTNISG